MQIHELKVHKNYVNPLLSGAKTFEVRRNDRDFQVGDILIMRPYDEKKQKYVSEESEFYYNVTYVLTGGKYGIEEGYCILGIQPNPAINRFGLLQWRYVPNSDFDSKKKNFLSID